MRVLLAYDRSTSAEQAVALVADLAWPAGSTVRVVAVIEPLAGFVPSMARGAPPIVPSPEVEAAIREDVQDAVDAVVARIGSPAVTVEGAVLRGRPATVLADEAMAFGADLVVVGTRGHGAIASLVLGSVSAELVDVAPCPVLVARRSSVERIVVASDGSGPAGRAASIVAEWPIFHAAQVRVVSVAEVVRPWHTGLAPTVYRQVVDAYSHDVERATAEHRVIAQEVAERLSDAGRTVEVSVPVGEPAAEIVAEVAAWQADLVVLGSRGHTGLTRVVLGSVARNVLHASEASVLVVRDPSNGAGG